jgi:hypothetical protein
VSFLLAILEHLGLPSSVAAIAQRVWAELPEAERDRLVADLLAHARAIALPVLRASIAYAQGRLAAGAPIEVFPELAPAMAMAEGGMSVPGPGDMWAAGKP